MTTELPRLLRQRLRAQADLFAALTAHPVLVGAGREHALSELLRQFLPRRFEILQGAVAIADEDQRPMRTTHQLDLIIVDTMDFPTLLRAGNTAVVLSQSVRAIVEVKSNLKRSTEFISALVQIAQARQRLGSTVPVLTALFSFGAPTRSETLRGIKTRDALLHDEVIGLENRESLLEVLDNSNLPNIVAADQGAVACKGTRRGVPAFYSFVGGTSEVQPIMVLIDKLVEHLATASTPSDVRGAMTVMRAHLETEASSVPDLKNLELPRHQSLTMTR
ncbi:MAG: hypothetical protein E6J91_01500 [Deltaproteobacteria bacterium]|nr:MAG: hypothetical protein E6J91_01500 [Deltaproteobacteria bacterium]